MSSQLQTNINAIDNKIKTLVFTSNAIINHTEALPYIELEYIQSSGTQYINTGIIPTQNTSVELDFDKNSTAGNQDFFGVNKSNNDYLYGFYDGGSDVWDNYNDDIKLRTGHISGRMIIRKTKNKTILSGNYSGTLNHSSTTFTAPRPLYLFTKVQADGSIFRPASIKCYYFKIWNNDELVRDLIPVQRKSDGVICLYDKISETYFENQGTGNFVGEVNGQVIEYIPPQTELSGTPILLNGELEEVSGITVNQYSMNFSNGEYVSYANNNAKGLYITNSTGSTKTFNIELWFSFNSSDKYIQLGYGTGSLPTMQSTGANRTSYSSGNYNTNTSIVKSYSVPNGYKFFIGFAQADYPHIRAITIS